MRQPQRHARQGRGTDIPATAGGGIDIRELTAGDVERIGDRLPLARLEWETYLVAWDGDDPVGHAHIAWAGTTLGLPEIQDVFVLESRRKQGIGTAIMQAAERCVSGRGHTRVSLSCGLGSTVQRMYEQLGYRDAGIEPQRVKGTIMVRLGPLHVDETLIYLVKDLAVDFGRARSSYSRQRPREGPT